MNDTFAVALAAVLGGAIYLAVRYVSLGMTRSVNDLEASIRKIRDLSDPRLSLMVREIWGERFLQFRSSDQGRTGGSLELWLPKPGWSAEFYPWIVKKSTDMGLQRREFVDTLGNKFVVIAFGADDSSAASFGTAVLTEMFGINADGKVKVRIDLHTKGIEGSE